MMDPQEIAARAIERFEVRRNFLNNPHAARHGRAAESCPAFAGNTSCPLSFLSDFSDKSSFESNRRVAGFVQLRRRNPSRNRTSVFIISHEVLWSAMRPRIAFE